MNAHLRKSKPKDTDIEDSPDRKGVRGRERSTADTALGRIPKKSGKEYGSNGRANATKRGKNGFAQRLIGQGGLFNASGNQEEKKDSGGEWLERLPRSSKSVFVFRLVDGLANSYPNCPFTQTLYEQSVRLWTRPNEH